jgi:acyl-CoA synthetase (AMP-forming)/AMP-acid ligase II
LIQEDLINKLDSLALSIADLSEYYGVYIQIANNSKDIQDFCKSWNATIYYNTESDADHWIKIENNQFSFGMGEISNPNVLLKIGKNEFLLSLTWYYDYILALFGGQMAIEGNDSDIDKFLWIDAKIRGKMLSIINKIKTDQEVKDKYTLSYDDYLLMQQRLRSKLKSLSKFADNPWYDSNPESKDSIGLRFEQRARDDPDRIAMFYEEEKYTNKEFNEWINKYANYFLNQIGLKKGDTAVVFLENRSEIMFIIISMAKIGVISSLINTRQRDQSLIHSITHAPGIVFIIGEELIDPFIEIQSRLELSKIQSQNLFFVPDKEKIKTPEGFINLKEAIADSPIINPPTTSEIQQKDPYSYIFTSGTTGLPKAAVITNGHTIGSAFYWAHMVMDMTPDDITYITTPIFHSNAINIGFASVIGGGGGMAIRRKYSASNFLKDARKYGCTAFNYVGEICRYLYNQPPRDNDKDHPIVKCAGNGIKPEFWMDFKNRFGIERIHEQYGATERFIPNFANILNLNKTVGMSLAVYAIVKYDVGLDEPIRDKNGHMVIVEPGEIGLLLGRVDPGSFYMYKDKKASEKKLFQNVFVEGDMWVNTGDLLRDIGFRHAMFADRLGDTYRWKGENVSTEEMEILINTFPQIEYSCAYGVLIPGTEGRAGMVSFIKKGDENLDFDKFSEFVNNKIPAYAIPIFLRVKKEFATTATDKIQKVKLKQEGYDVNEIEDPIYIRLPQSSTYVPLTKEIYEGIMAGKYKY